uniref:Acyltransferase n=1 Tax=Buteo japonicus TaxID=224669 RepID=A0A8C0HQ30_9AVES
MSIPHPTPSHPSLPHCFILLILPPTLPPYPSHGYHQSGPPHGYLGQHLWNLRCFGLGAVSLPAGSRASIQTALRGGSRWGGHVPAHPPPWLPAGTVSLLLLIYLVFTSFWPISALYLAWVIFDWDTPEKGGRRLPCLRQWPVWRHFRDYFPVKLVKTHDLSPSHNYIIGSHPHGILCVGAFCNFVTGSTGFGEMFPGIRPSLTTLAGNFRLPVFREYLMSGGDCTGGGGGRPGVTTLILKNRKGFVRMALQHGAYLVPSFSFGENDLFRQVVFEEGSWMRSIQQRFQKMMGFAPCVFYGRGLTSVRSRGFLPYARPITTVVGEPVTVPKIEDPSCETVDMYHEMYVRSLLKLFNENKTKYGLSETDELHIL